MSNTLMDTMRTAKHDATSATERALGTATEAMESARESTQHTFVSTVATVLKGVSAVSGLVSVLRGLDRDDGLAWFGLARRRPLRSVAMFGAGLAVGAGAAMLLTPMAGVELRRLLLGGGVAPAPQVAANKVEAAEPIAPGDARAAASNGEAGKSAKPEGGVITDRHLA